MIIHSLMFMRMGCGLKRWTISYNGKLSKVEKGRGHSGCVKGGVTSGKRGKVREG